MRLGGGKGKGEGGTANATGDAFYCHVLRNEGDTQRERRTGGQQDRQAAPWLVTEQQEASCHSNPPIPLPLLPPHLTGRAEKHFRFHTQIGRFKTRQIFQCLFTICSSIHSKFSSSP